VVAASPKRKAVARRDVRVMPCERYLKPDPVC
jgi:hypothetical protein